MIDLTKYNEEAFLSKKDLAEIYGITVRSVNNLMKKPNFPIGSFIGQRRFWKVKDIVAYQNKDYRLQNKVL